MSKRRYPDVKSICAKCGSEASTCGPVNDWYTRCPERGGAHEWERVDETLRNERRGVV